MSKLGKISNHFTWKEALYLPQYGRLAEDSDGLNMEIRSNLCDLFNKMDAVRDFFNKPISVHVAYRSPEYNKLVKGASKSCHLEGKAVDFHVVGLSCDEAKKLILDNNKLEEWSMRMENNGQGTTWIHLDLRSPGPGGRFFKP